MDLLIVAAIGIFLGVFTRTLLPYLKKLREAEEIVNKKFAFDIDFIYTAVFSAVVSFAITMFLLPSFSQYNLPPMIVFASAYTGGFTADSLVNEIISQEIKSKMGLGMYVRLGLYTKYKLAFRYNNGKVWIHRVHMSNLHDAVDKVSDWSIDIREIIAMSFVGLGSVCLLFKEQYTFGMVLLTNMLTYATARTVPSRKKNI